MGLFPVKKREIQVNITMIVCTLVLRKMFLVLAALLVLLQVSEANEVPISNRIWVASTTLKQL